MKTYRIEVSYQAPYPKEFVGSEQAHSFATAIARTLRKWKKENKGQRVKQLSIKAITL